MSTLDWVRQFGPSVAGLATSVLGLQDATRVEQLVFGGGAAIAVVSISVEAISRYRYREPLSIRRRCHHVLKLIAVEVFPGDSSLRLTILSPTDHADVQILKPIVRVCADTPDAITFVSKARFRSNGSIIIKQAWLEPGGLKVKSIPAPSFNGSRLQACAWYVREMEMTDEEAGKLSDETLLKTRSMADIGLRFPTSNQTVGLVSLSSRSENAFQLDEARSAKLGRYMEMLAILLAPLDK